MDGDLGGFFRCKANPLAALGGEADSRRLFYSFMSIKLDSVFHFEFFSLRKIELPATFFRNPD